MKSKTVGNSKERAHENKFDIFDFERKHKKIKG